MALSPAIKSRNIKIEGNKVQSNSVEKLQKFPPCLQIIQISMSIYMQRFITKTGLKEQK